MEKQYQAYQGDDSEENRVRLQEIQNQLKEVTDDLEESEYDRYISDTEKLLDDLYLEFESVINMRLDNLDSLVISMIAQINSNSGAICDTLSSTAEFVGYTLSTEMSNIWDSNSTKITDVLTTYGQNITNGIQSANTTLNNTLNGIWVNIKDMVTKLNAIADVQVKSATSSSATKSAQANAAVTSSISSSSSSASSSGSGGGSGGGGDGVPRVGDAVTFVSGKYYYSPDGKSPTGKQMLGQTVYITKIDNASWATKPYHIARDREGKRPLGWLTLGQLSGYKKGKDHFSRDEIAWINEGGAPEVKIGRDGTITTADGAQLTKIQKGGSVLNSEATKNLIDMANNPAGFVHDNMLRNLKLDMLPAPSQNAATVDIGGVEFVINANSADWNGIKQEIMRDKQIEKFVQSVTVEPIAGKSRLGKYHV